MGGEFILVTVLLFAYKRVRTLTRSHLNAAFDHARDVLGMERAIGFAIEDNLQQFLLRHHAAVWILNHYYAYLHFTPIVILIVWLYRFHPDVYVWMRRLMVGVTFTALAVHVLYPLAPPRMMPGFVDTMRAYGPQIYQRNQLAGVANQIAAMPSLHFGWAVILAASVIKAARWRYRWIIIVHPAMMMLAIVGTANHWWLDAAVAGVIVAGVWITQHFLGVGRFRRWIARNFTPTPIAPVGRTVALASVGNAGHPSEGAGSRRRERQEPNVSPSKRSMVANDDTGWRRNLVG